MKKGIISLGIVLVFIGCLYYLWREINLLKVGINDFRQIEIKLESTIVVDKDGYKKYLLSDSPDCELNGCIEELKKGYHNICDFKCIYRWKL